MRSSSDLQSVRNMRGVGANQFNRVLLTGNNMNSPTMTGLIFKRLCKTTLLMLLVAGSLLASLPLQAADKIPSDKLLPPNVYAYASFPSVAEMKKSFIASPKTMSRASPR